MSSGAGPGILARRLAENLRAYRAERLLSTAALARRLGVHRSYVGRIESGAAGVSLATVVAVAGRLGLHPATLLLDGEPLRADRRRVGGGGVHGGGVHGGGGAGAGAGGRAGDGSGDGAGANVLSQQLAENLRAHRASHGLSQEELGERLGLRRSAVARIEAEEDVTLARVAGLAALLGVHAADLVDGPLVRADRAAWLARGRRA